MNPPNPAIVSQAAVQRLPRTALLLLGLAYALAGFVGRDAWRNAELATFGVMVELASGTADWWAPAMAGLPAPADALLPYWLGAAAIRLAPLVGLDPMLASRLPFMALLALTLAATWYAAYHLARRPEAQPVAFAFGGEAKPTDYARALADAALLALMATLGLAQLSHEATAAQAQLAFSACLFVSAAALGRPARWPTLLLPASALALALSGAPTLSLLMCVAVVITVSTQSSAARIKPWLWPAVGMALALTVSLGLDLMQWRLAWPPPVARDMAGTARLLLWFTWPAGLLAVWALWSWRRRLTQPHIALPASLLLVVLLDTLLGRQPDRTLLLALPPLAVLAAFALPTLRRGVAALIDWFTLLFFSFCALAIWVVWASLHLGWPAQPAINVGRLMTGFEPRLSASVLLLALAATAAWGWLVLWRASRHRQPIWKSLVLPAGGASLCWVLLMTLCLPLLDRARSDAVLARALADHVPATECIAFDVVGPHALSAASLATARHLAGRDLRAAHSAAATLCPWRLMDARGGAWPTEPPPDALRLRRPTDRSQDSWWLVRAGTSSP